MKKLMFVAALAASTAAFAKCAEPDTPDVEVARCYQVQLNTYTTKGVALGGQTISGGNCGEGSTVPCAVVRGRDKTVIRGYVWMCERSCEIKDYESIFCDIKRAGEGTGLQGAFEVKFCNAIGQNLDQAEIFWILKDTFTYEGKDSTGAARTQDYELNCSGYGKVKADSANAMLYFDKFQGYFAGFADGSYDFSTAALDNSCACDRSTVVKCENYKGGADWRLYLDDEDTVAFGAWKMKYNASLSQALLKKDAAVYLLECLQKMFATK